MAYKSHNLNSIPGIDHGFGTIDDGTFPTHVFTLEQQHSSDVIMLDENSSDPVTQGDALFTFQDRPIAIITADCVPILVGCSSSSIVGAIHAGWKGLVGDIIENSILTIQNQGIVRSDLHVAIGPCIGGCCYEVSRPLLQIIEGKHGHLWEGQAPPWSTTQPRNQFGSILPEAIPTDGYAWLDLVKYAIFLLESAGVMTQQIETINVCTYCSGQNLGSYRRRHHFNLPKKFQYSWISNSSPSEG